MVEQNGEINRYPISDLDITEDQVIMNNGRRLSGTNFLSIDKEGSSFAEPNPINADTLGGKLASEYATNDFVNERVRKAAPRNLLDNSDFRNPVNQRGASKYIGNLYCFDRWISWSPNGQMVSEKQNGYVSFWNGDTSNGSLQQKFESGTFNKNKTYTLVWAETDENVYIQNDAIYYNAVSNTEDIAILFEADQTRNIVWAALYEGEYTIDTLPEYQPKGYGAELAECMRYFERIGRENGKPDLLGQAFFVPSGSTGAKVFVPFTVKKRIDSPTCTLSNASQYRLREYNAKTGAGVGAASLTSISVSTHENYGILLQIGFSATSSDYICCLQRHDSATSARIDVSADL